MDPLYNPLRTRPIQTGREMSIELYLNRQFWSIDDLDRQSGSGLVWTQTHIRSDDPEPLLTLPLASGAIRACLRERDIWEREIGERNIMERDIGDRDIGEREMWERGIGQTVPTCQFAE